MNTNANNRSRPEHRVNVSCDHNAMSCSSDLNFQFVAMLDGYEPGRGAYSRLAHGVSRLVAFDNLCEDLAENFPEFVEKWKLTPRNV